MSTELANSHGVFERENQGVITNFYELGNELSRGDNSVTISAWHKQEGKQYAVKIVKKHDVIYQQIRDELYVSAKVNHENIVSYKEVFQTFDRYLIVMELLRGAELFDQIISTGEWYSERAIVQVVKQVFLAVQHLHQLNIVHKDLRPENFLVASSDFRASVKIVDLSFACHCPNDKSQRTSLSTPFVAPEVAALRQPVEGQPGYGRPVDIWALGVCLYIMLSGVHPFQVVNVNQMLDNIEIGYWDWFGDNWDKISPAAKNLISGMLQPNDDARLTIDQCLGHAWITGAPNLDLKGVAEAVSSYQARQKYKEPLVFGIPAPSKVVMNEVQRELERLQRMKEETMHS